MIKIIDRKESEKTDFEKNYMFTEAPSDTERVNVKRIRLKAPGSRTYDFRKGADGEEETPEEDMEPTDTEPADDTTGSDDIAVDDNDDISVDDTPDMIGDEDPDATGDDDIATDDDINSGDPDGGSPGDTGDGETVSPDDNTGSGDDDIVTDDNGDISEDDTSGTDDTGDDTTGDDDSGEETDGDSEDAMHKQNLYKKFVTLRTAIDNYDHKLSAIIGVDPETHKMIHEVTNKLRSMGDMMYDYMVLKFKKNTYLESMMFYQRTMAATNLCLDALTKIGNKTKKESDKSHGKTKPKTKK